MFPVLLLLFVTIPLVELYVLIEVGGTIGALPAVGLCIVTAALGAALVRAQGLSTIAQAQRSVQQGEIPAMALLEGVVLLVTGALLLTPGLVTDALGFACLVPPLRRRLILRLVRDRLRPAHQGAGGPRGRIVIEGEFRHHDEDEPRLKRPQR